MGILQWEYGKFKFSRGDPDPPLTPSLNQDPRMHLAQNGYRIFVVKRCVQILTSYD